MKNTPPDENVGSQKQDAMSRTAFKDAVKFILYEHETLNNKVQKQKSGGGLTERPSFHPSVFFHLSNSGSERTHADTMRERLPLDGGFEPGTFLLRATSANHRGTALPLTET